MHRAEATNEPETTATGGAGLSTAFVKTSLRVSEERNIPPYEVREHVVHAPRLLEE